MNFKQYIIYSIPLCISLLSSPLFANELAELKNQLQAMQQQMSLMQSKLESQELVLKKQDKITSDIKHQQAFANKGSKGINAVVHELADSIAIGGVIEVIANHSNSNAWSGESSSDIALDTFELGIEASATDWVSASMLFLYEDTNNDNLTIDEAFISIANPEVTPFYASVGRIYVPFGSFESNMISDPATLTLAETREDVIQIGFEMENGLYGSTYIFNGDSKQAKDNYSHINNHIDNYGVNIGYTINNDNFSLDVGAAYLNNIASSDSLQDLVADNGLCSEGGCIKDYIGGLSLHTIVSIGQVDIIAEYISAMNHFSTGEINATKAKPKAWNLEAAYHFSLAGNESTFAIGYQKTKDMNFDNESTDLFEHAWLTSLSIAILDNTTLAAEWRHANGYSKTKDSIGGDFEDEDLLQVKLSYEF
jgi:hypothetical protein